MGAYLSLIGRGRGWGARLFEAGRLLTFSAFRMGAYSRWALIRGWALIRINTVRAIEIHFFKQNYGMRTLRKTSNLLYTVLFLNETGKL